MSTTPTIPPSVNRAMKFFLRSPLHGLVSKTILLISFTGCKSGKTYTTPVSYSQVGDEVFIFTHATWWKNLCGGAPVTLRIKGHEFYGRAEVVADDKETVAAGLAEHLRRVPSDARWYGVTLDAHRNPDAAAVAEAAQTVVMIRVRLVTESHPTGALT